MLSLTNSEVLHAFLDAAAGEGLVLGGVDAADLYVAIFPERYARAIAGLDAGTGAVPAPDSTTPDQGDERRAILRAAVAAMPSTNPLVADDLIEGHTMHTEADDIVAIWKAAQRAAVQPVAQEAIAWSPAGYNKELAVDATGKVRGEVCEHSIDPRWDARANDRRLGEYLTRDQAKAAVLAALAAPHPPVSAEAGKGVEPFGWFAWGASGNSIRFWTTDRARAESYTRETGVACNPLYERPSESVAVSGEVSEPPMPWLKCTPCFKHGHGQPVYEELWDTHPDWVDDLKHTMREEHGDPEGLREPKWEIVDMPPREVLEKKLADAIAAAKGSERKAARYRAVLALAGSGGK